MCGFAGYIGRKDRFFADDVILEKMHTTIAHRGPDGKGVWVSEKHKVAFVYRRLSIIDLTQAGSQPMFDREQTVVIMFNGEIYNYQKLRTELEGCGYVFTSQSDTEVFLYAFKEWGIDCLHKLEGMFAAVLGDLVNDEWYCVRDRIGVKPFYFSLEGGYFNFASEIKTLWNLPWLTKKLNNQALYHYLTFLVTPAPYTLYQGVYKLPAGMYVKLDKNKELSFQQWYTPLISAHSYRQEDLANEQFCVNEIRTLLTAAVQKRMISDVPFGVFLSGGIDSSLITALMSRFTDRVKTFNVSFSDGPEYSEVAWARKVSKLFNTEHHEITISEKEAFEFFQTMVYHQDEPLADSVCIPLYYVSKLLRDAGVTVVQVGEGSDELYCGYETYGRYLDAYNRYYRPTAGIPTPFKKAGTWLAAQLFPQKYARLGLLEQWASGHHLFWSGATAFTEGWKHELLTEAASGSCEDPVVAMIYPELNQACDSYAIIDYHLKKFYETAPNGDFLQSMIYLELKQRLPELLLMRVDKMTMATSVEGRVPFLDHAHVEFALQVPTALKYRNGTTKYILKKACEGILPEDVIYRKKIGFAAPTTRWFKKGTYFKDYFAALVEKKQDTLSQVFEKKAITSLLMQTQSTGADYATQLWVLQNVLATEVFG